MKGPIYCEGRAGGATNYVVLDEPAVRLRE